MVLLAMSTLLYHSGNYEEAIEKLQKIQQLSSSSIIVRVAASEALVGLHLELGQDDASSVIVNVCLRLLETIKIELGSAGFGALEDHSRALKGLVELVRGDTKSAASFFPEVRDGDCSSNVLDRFIGNAALSYGEFLHRMGDFEMAKQLYTRVIHEESLGKSSSYLHQLSACNMSFEDVIFGATCALGQLEAHLGNFDKAEKMLTEALVKAGETFGDRHPKVGVILTCVGHMYRRKSTVEESSSLLIQEVRNYVNDFSKDFPVSISCSYCYYFFKPVYYLLWLDFHPVRQHNAHPKYKHRIKPCMGHLFQYSGQGIFS
nr:uncharacterized protein LOC109181871 isoform X1 [Ipomoea batatas]